MPHLNIEYSPELDQKVDMAALCDALRTSMIETGIFPEGGIRVRAFAASHVALADADPRNAFADLILRLGKGRSEEVKRAAGGKIMARAEQFFAAQLAEPYFALALEMIEIQELSWKKNAIHPRLSKQD